MTENPGHDVWLRQARSHLRGADAVLARLIDERPDFDPRAWLAQLPPMDLYGALLFQVAGQQLSVPVTRRFLARVEGLFGGHLPSPAELLARGSRQAPRAGLSWRKIATLRDLAGRLSDGRLDLEVLSGLSDDELMAELTAISGRGPWTVQGALILALGGKTSSCRATLRSVRPSRPLIGSTISPARREVLSIAERWRPYRSLATSYLFSAAFERADAPVDTT